MMTIENIKELDRTIERYEGTLVDLKAKLNEDVTEFLQYHHDKLVYTDVAIKYLSIIKNAYSDNINVLDMINDKIESAIISLTNCDKTNNINIIKLNVLSDIKSAWKIEG